MTGDGFTYGEGIYSLEIYAYETVWVGQPCQISDTRRKNSLFYDVDYPDDDAGSATRRKTSAHYEIPLPPPMSTRREDSAYGD